MHIPSYVPRLIAALALGGALLVPAVASADGSSGIQILGNPRTTSYYDASGNYVGYGTTTDDVTVLGNGTGMTVAGNPTTTTIYDTSGRRVGTAHTSDDVTVLGN
jgi:hypothetical protein